ncbi:Aste57867_19802 [Aphanomyces stellatus]|uniref:Aste57867_19802 protein n=1 Tax=Aphanomyces stellatus TaxID=120398 RepID=A0A485LDG6_9STRA|nr:hypothetical protein As57867_019737 [Aphanomyces stellatus]VFT96500.1 Aste57867_19802 [Aphanomyces stellatus]
MLLFLSVLVTVVVGAANESTATLLGPCNVGAYCLQDTVTGIITSMWANATSLDLANRSIETVMVMPTHPSSINLSFNRIRMLNQVELPTNNASLRLLNLSHNALTLQPTGLPSSVQILDLGYNSITAFDMSLSWSYTQLSLKANNMYSLMLTSANFPPNLMALDLSENPQLVLTIDDVVLAKLLQPNFKLNLMTNRARSGACSAMTTLIQSQLVCVVKAATSEPTTHTTQVFTILVLVLSVAFGFCIALCRMWCCRPRDDTIYVRGTMCSSLSVPLARPIQFSPTPVRPSRFVH